MLSVLPWPVENLGKVCENFRADENARLGVGFSADMHSNSPKRPPRFSPGYEGTENMFYFLSNFTKAALNYQLRY